MVEDPAYPAHEGTVAYADPTTYLRRRTTMSDLLNTPNAARRLGLSSATLEHWRMARKGPPFIRMGFRKIYYRAADLDQWIESRVDANEGPR